MNIRLCVLLEVALAVQLPLAVRWHTVFFSFFQIYLLSHLLSVGVLLNIDRNLVSCS